MSSLSPPAVPSKQARPPQPASSRPRKLANQLPLRDLWRVPVRLLSPPKATGMVGSVRSLAATPIGEVKLQDVLDNKHLSPLSLKDFEVRWIHLHLLV